MPRLTLNHFLGMIQEENCRNLVTKLPCIMDPVINGLSFESPCKPSLGMARLINPERQAGTITHLMSTKTCGFNSSRKKRYKTLPSQGAPSRPRCALPMGPSIMSYVRFSSWPVLGLRVFSLEFLIAFEKKRQGKKNVCACCKEPSAISRFNN